MVIPYKDLSDGALHGVLEEFVTRDGTDLDDAEDKIALVRRRLERGEVVIWFDESEGTCNIVQAETLRDLGVALP